MLSNQEYSEDTLIKSILKILFVLIFGISIYMTLTIGFGINSFRIVGTSMFPNINHGDVCVTYSRIFTSDVSIERNDIITFNGKRGNELIKRVIGFPGDRIRIEGGLVFVNGERHDHPSILFEITNGKIDITLGKNKYFVLGDNRANSKDSRTFGPINKEQIIGKVWIKWRSMTEH